MKSYKLSFSGKKKDFVGVIKAVRSLTNMSLKDAKDLVENSYESPVVFEISSEVENSLGFQLHTQAIINGGWNVEEFLPGWKSHLQSALLSAIMEKDYKVARQLLDVLEG